MPTNDKDGHLFGDAYFNADYFHVGNEAAEKTYINMENEELEIHNLKAPTNDNDAATKKYVDDIAGGGGAKIFLQAEEPEEWGAGDWWYQILTDDGGDDSGDDTPPE